MFRSSKSMRVLAGAGGRSSVSGLIVTVFGCTGFLGRYVVNKFGRIGSQVVLPYRGNETDFTHLKVMGDVGQIVPLPFHPRHQESIETAISKSNVVVNLIGQYYDTKNFTIEQANIDTAARIAEACAAKDNVQRVIYMSSVHASKDSPSRLYKAKAEAEKITKDLLGDRATIVRSTQLFGAEDRLLNRLGGAVRYWPVVPRLPDRVVAPVDVANVADAIVAIALSNDSRTFELQGPSAFQQQELFEALCRVMHRDSTKFHELPEPLMQLGVKILSKMRRPAITEDEYTTIGVNDIADPKMPGLAELDITPTSLEQAAISTIRKYRPPQAMYAVGNEDVEQVKADMEQRLSPKNWSYLRHPLDTTPRKLRLFKQEELPALPDEGKVHILNEQQNYIINPDHRVTQT